MPDDLLIESLLRHIGQSVTIFTTSGGLSGSGFTGTLVSIGNGTVRLITDIGGPPACPVGSDCTGPLGGGYGSGGGFGGFGSGFGNGGGFGSCFGGYGGFGSGGFGNFGGYGGFGGGCGCGCGGGFSGNWLGSITEIPINRIASFTHVAI
jgi:hypothetical protein